MQVRSTINLNLGDSLEAMKLMPDNAYDLAIVDPPYGLGSKLAHDGNGQNAQSKFSDDFKAKSWDNQIPSDLYFKELLRVSKRQIVWGGNYFPFLWKKHCRGLITWDKMVYITTMSQVEYAWYSEDVLPVLVKINNTDKNRIHLTQKPVKLYEWLLTNYANEGDKILDTHGGSMSIALACHNLKFDLDLWELDEDYHAAGVKRFNNHIKQLQLF